MDELALDTALRGDRGRIIARSKSKIATYDAIASDFGNQVAQGISSFSSTSSVIPYAQAGEALGFGLSRLIAILTPPRIVLAGPGTRAMALIEPHLKRALEAGIVGNLSYNVDNEVVPIDTDMIIKGTIGRALRHADREIFALGPLPRRGRKLERVS